MQKSETVIEILKKNFPTVKFREAAEIIRFNVDSLKGKQLAPLAHISMTLVKDLKVKRSGTGLVVIVTL